MDATALAHTSSSRFIRFSSAQITGSTAGRSSSFSVARNTGGTCCLPDDTSSPMPPPPAAKNADSGRRSTVVSASIAINDRSAHLLAVHAPRPAQLPKAGRELPPPIVVCEHRVLAT
uniref:Uncharacterized protein n=1 Tax=Zea mays TaxID=4577 RepID=A0A804R0P9_MAIZE